MEYTSQFQWMNIPITVSCLIILFVASPLRADRTSPDQTQHSYDAYELNYMYEESDSMDIDIRYDYDRNFSNSNRGPSSALANVRRYNKVAPTREESADQFSSDTAFVDHYIAPLGPTYRFLDRDRQHEWQKTTLKYTFIDLDSSLSYKSTMMGWDFKAEAEGEVLDESSLSLNWSRHF